jgi:hypothetical protein
LKKITHYFLYKNEACPYHRKLFRELYPNGIEVCWKCFKKAQSQGLEVYWLNRFVANLYVKNIICGGALQFRKFPKLADRFGLDSWETFAVSDKGLKLLEEELLKRI